MAPVSLSLLLIFSSLVGSEGNKFSSLSLCQLPIGDGQAWCEKLVAAWGCEVQWYTKCPGVTHPAGPAHDRDSLNKNCHAECMHFMHKAGKEGAPATSGQDDEQEKIKELETMSKKVMHRAEAVKKTGELNQAKNLEIVAQAEVLLELNELPGLEMDPQELAAEKMAGKQAALRVAEHDFNAETDVIFSGVKINEKARKHYQKSIATLGRECGDDAEADEVAEDEADNLKKAVKRKGEMTKFESEKGLAAADYMENQCSEATMNLEFFVGRITADDHLHAGSSFLMEAYSGKMHQLAHQLEFHAKAAMVLHHESNDLANHFVDHLNHQEDSREAKVNGEELGSHTHHLRTSAIEKLYAVAKVTNVTEKQLAYLHQLDEKHHHVIHGESKEDMCSSHAKRLRKVSADSPLNSEGVKGYVDCLCKDKQPSLLCQARHGEAIQDAAQKIGANLAKATQKMDAELGAVKLAAQSAVARSDFQPDNSSLALARSMDNSNQSVLPIGPCSQPISCRICLNGAACISAPFPGNGKDAFGELRTRIDDAGNGPPCLSGSCEACIAIAPPAEPVTFVAAIGFAGNCHGGAQQYIDFHFALSFSVCFGHLGEVLEWLGMECIELATARYHPYIGKLIPPSLSIKLLVVHASAEVSVPAHDLTQPVRNHCKHASQLRVCSNPWTRRMFRHVCRRSPEANCLGIFYAARGSGSFSLTLKVGILWWWKTVFSKTWNF